MDWTRILAYVTGTVDQELLARNEYLAAENRILKAQLNGRLRLSDAERGVLGEIGHRLGRKVLADIATVAQPDTILGWYRKLIARKFDGSKARRYPGRPRIKREVEELILRMASENRDWGYDRIAGALGNLGYEISDQTVGNVLRRHGLPPAPERKRTTTWAAFIRTHLALLAGTDFFTAEVLTLRGLVTYYVLFFIHLESRRVDIAGLTVHPDEAWMKQIARNATMEDCGALRDCRYLLHDRDTKFTRSFRAILVSGRVKPLALPARSPNLNAYAERWVRSVKDPRRDRRLQQRMPGGNPGLLAVRPASDPRVGEHHGDAAQAGDDRLGQRHGANQQRRAALGGRRGAGYSAYGIEPLSTPSVRNSCRSTATISDSHYSGVFLFLRYSCHSGRHFSCVTTSTTSSQRSPSCRRIHFGRRPTSS